MAEVSSFDEIIAGAQRGRHGAFDKLVEEYAPRLYGFAYRYTGSGPDAEDIVQEVFLKLVRAIGTYSHQQHFEAWLFRIAMNVIRDRARKAGRRIQAESLESVSYLSDGDFDAEAHEPDDASSSSETSSATSPEVSQRLHGCINQLPEPERMVILLRHYADLSFAEISNLMDAPLGTSLARAHRGLAKLRQWMEAGS